MSSAPYYTSPMQCEDEDGEKERFSHGNGSRNGKASLFIIIAVCVIAVICLIVGIALMVKSGGRRTVYSHTKSTSKNQANEQCKFSKEAERIGLEAFLTKVKQQFYKYHPENTALHPDAATDKEKVRRDYSAYIPTPAKIKERTDAAISLLAEISKKVGLLIY